MSYRFTDGQKLNSDEIESVFCNLTSKVTAENYSTMVSQGLYLETSIPIANTTEMIKFRYYNPSHVLIEQENVPIVLDGNGVKTHTVYTALSTTANKPDAASFSTTVKNVSSVNKYLWQYEVTEYTNGTIEGSYADAKIIGVYGDKGETGSRGGIYLGCFATNAQDDSPDMSSSVVFVENDYYLSSSDGYIYLYTNSAWNAITNYTDSRYFEAVNDALGNGLVSDTTQNIVKAVNAWTQNLVAGTALINKLFAKEMTMENGGVFKSQNYNGTITTTTDSEGNVTNRVLVKNGSTGFAMDSHGNVDVVGLRAYDAQFTGTLESSKQKMENIYFRQIAVISFGYYTSGSLPYGFEISPASSTSNVKCLFHSTDSAGKGKFIIGLSSSPSSNGSIYLGGYSAYAKTSARGSLVPCQVFITGITSGSIGSDGIPIPSFQNLTKEYYWYRTQDSINLTNGRAALKKFSTTEIASDIPSEYQNCYGFALFVFDSSGNYIEPYGGLTTILNESYFQSARTATITKNNHIYTYKETVL